MILNELTIQNFGVYAGLQSIILTSEPDKPIILIGGLNGRGKTTFLDAIQLVLYGKSANCSNRGSLAYDQYLAKCRHHNSQASEPTFIELSFSHAAGGKVSHYRVHRSWDGERSTPKEQIRVWLNGKEEPFLADSWSDHVEGLVPNGVSQLFFFDGEKIEQLADPKNAPKILNTGINSLLGLDIIDRLSSDLTTLEKKNPSRSGDEVANKILRAQAELDELSALHSATSQEVAGAQVRVDYLLKEVTELEADYQSRGGNSANERNQLLSDHSLAEATAQHLQVSLKEWASGIGPFLFIKPLLMEIEKQSDLERKADESRLLNSILEKRDAEVVNVFQKAKLAPPIVKEVARLLRTDRDDRQSNSRVETYLAMTRNGSDDLKNLVRALPKANQSIKDALNQYRLVSEKAALIEKKLASAPSEDSLSNLTKKLTEKRKDLGRLEGTLEQKEAKLKSLSTELDRQVAIVRNLREKALRSEWAIRDQDRILVHSSKVKLTLEQFKRRILLKHIERIEMFVLESFKLLLQKPTLIGGVKIDPVTLELSLRGAADEVIAAERLSAGERQLLAVSLLWGLGKASGRTLPTIIDTPLGRLDSKHRINLVERYFPNASHQVILLSTDEEINGNYRKALLPKIAKTYLIEYSDALGSSSIHEKYFTATK
jgi:DNA sulfur modification protein DndD